MHKTLISIFVILFYSCGEDNATNPNPDPGPDYYSSDNTFITELLNSNAIELDSLNNRITTITTEEGKDRITIMDLSNLGLEILPEQIINLEKLEELDLSNNLFNNFPEELCIVSSRISNLNIGNNNLCNPTEITHCILQEVKIDFEKQECVKVKYDEEMDFLLEFIKSNDLDSISSTIFNQVKWSWSDTDSALTDDDKQIERIVEIKWDDFGIINLPGTISHLEFLNRLQLENNQLETLPAQMKFLKNLTYLDLHNNMLIALPEFIGNVDNLTSLYLQNNLLSQLPVSIGELSQLEFFDIGENRLSSLPDILCELYDNDLEINLECNDLEIGDDVPECLESQLGSQKDDPQCSVSAE